MKLEFSGPMGIAYPQLRPEVDSFDDSIRKDPTGPKEEEAEMKEAKPAISTVPDAEENLQLAAKAAIEAQAQAVSI